MKHISTKESWISEMYFSRFSLPQPIENFTNTRALKKSEFNPDRFQFWIDKHAAGIKHEFRPTPKQLRDWMNNEIPVPHQYHMAIYDFIGKLDGSTLMMFTHNNGASIRGLVHLMHEVRSTADSAVHWVDRYSDIGDQREVYLKGYQFM